MNHQNNAKINEMMNSFVKEGAIGAIKTSGALDINFIQKNPSTGKVKVTQESIVESFCLIDKANLQEKDSSTMKIKLVDIKKRMQTINPNFPVNELSLLTGNKPEITVPELYSMLTEFEIEDLDPVSESLDLLMDNDGCFDYKKFKKISAGLGYPEMSANEIKILHECFDLDKDGKVTKKDFKEIFKLADQNRMEKEIQMKAQQQLQGLNDDDDDE